jgi:hypothetical protein
VPLAVITVAIFLNLFLLRFLQLSPEFSFSNTISATKWGVQTAVLQKQYESTDPQVATAARLEVNKLAVDFQRKYKIQWPEEERERKLMVFTDNLWRISQINIRSAKTGWYAALTQYADLTDQEFADKFLLNKDFTTPPRAKLGRNRK